MIHRQSVVPRACGTILHSLSKGIIINLYSVDQRTATLGQHNRHQPGTCADVQYVFRIAGYIGPGAEEDAISPNLHGRAVLMDCKLLESEIGVCHFCTLTAVSEA